MEINERIELLIGTLGFNPHSFTKTLGIKSTSTIPNILREKERRPSYELLNRIALRFPAINMNWLITGDGEMISSNTDNRPTTNGRIRAIMDFYKLTETDMIERCGCHPAEVKEIINGETQPGEDTLFRIYRAFPNISEGWFYHNQGRMFNAYAYRGSKTGEPDITGIPLYKTIDIVKGTAFGRPEAVLQIEGYDDCDFATYIVSKTMEPEVKAGDIGLFKTAKKDLIFYGQVYVIQIMKGHHLGMIKKGPSPEELSVEFPESSQLDPMVVTRSSIAALFLLRGYVRRLW